MNDTYYIIMKGKVVLMALMLAFAANVSAQKYKGHFANEDLKIKLELNLYGDSIPVPGLEMDSCYGYLQGNLNGTWVILRVKNLEDKKAIVRASCDNGSDTQDLELVATDSTVTLRQIDEANIKTISGKKYVKLPKQIILHR